MLDKIDRLEQQPLQSGCSRQHIPSCVGAVRCCIRATSIPALLLEDVGCIDEVTEASLKLACCKHAPDCSPSRVTCSAKGLGLYLES